MNILFVSRQKRNGEISPIVKKQGKSLEGLVNMHYFLIKGKGIMAYVKNIAKIRSYARKHEVDLIHAHYSFSGFSAALSFCKPTICSLMGSDIQAGGVVRFLIKLFYGLFWKATIVKSQRMKEGIKLNKAIVLPNGVDMKAFVCIEKVKSLDKTGFDPGIKNIAFLAAPSRHEKNFALAKEAVDKLGTEQNATLHTLHGIIHRDIPFYLNAADVLLLTSKWEGSPNAIKEAMACNCPIVSTDVGDVKEVIGNTEGCYITSYDPEDVAEKLKMALEYGKRTNGREKIKYLDEKIIAEKLVEIYKSVLKK